MLGLIYECLWFLSRIVQIASMFHIKQGKHCNIAMVWHSQFNTCMSFLYCAFLYAIKFQINYAGQDWVWLIYSTHKLSWPVCKITVIWIKLMHHSFPHIHQRGINIMLKSNYYYMSSFKHVLCFMAIFKLVIVNVWDSNIATDLVLPVSLCSVLLIRIVGWE